jgi:hypothetical protein
MSACPPITLTSPPRPTSSGLPRRWWRGAVAPATLDQVAHTSQPTLTVRRADPPDTLGMLLSRLRTGDAQNLGARSVPDADTLLDQVAAITGVNGSIVLDKVIQAERLYVTNAAWISLAQGTFVQTMRPEVRGLSFGSDQPISLTTGQNAYLAG